VGLADRGKGRQAGHGGPDHVEFVRQVRASGGPASCLGATFYPHPQAAILTLTTVTIFAGARSLEAIAQFGRGHGAVFALALGYRHRSMVGSVVS